MAEEKKPPSLTKQGRVEQHFREKRNLSSKEAYDLYGATRLAAIVLKLKNKGWTFVVPAKTEEGKDRYGNQTVWARYELVSEPDENALKNHSVAKKPKAKNKSNKPSTPMPTEIPEGKTLCLRPKTYNKSHDKTLEFSGKKIIQINLFDNGNQEI